MDRTYPFTLGPFTLGAGEGADPIILEFCHRYQVYLEQVAPSVWRTVACFRQLCLETKETLILTHMMRLYSPKIFHGGVLNLSKRSHHALLISVDDNNDHEWMEQFVVIDTRDIIPTTAPAFPESWNLFRKFFGYLFPFHVKRKFFSLLNFYFLHSSHSLRASASSRSRPMDTENSGYHHTRIPKVERDSSQIWVESQKSW